MCQFVVAVAHFPRKRQFQISFQNTKIFKPKKKTTSYKAYTQKMLEVLSREKENELHYLFLQRKKNML